MPRLLPLLLLAACGNTCGDGTMQVEHLCVGLPDDTDVYDPPDDAPTLHDVFAGLPECVPSEGDGRVDLDTACADGACAGMSKLEIDGVLGDAGFCREDYFNPRWLSCEWDVGISAYFDDLDQDGVADPDAEASSLYLDERYEGATTDGLGIGSSWSCFFDALGDPDAVYLWQDGDDYAMLSVSWFDPNLYGSDYYGTGAPSTLGISLPY